MDRNNLKAILQGEMDRHKLNKKTQSLYSMWIKRLEQYSSSDLSQLNATYGQSFLEHLLKREKLSRQSAHQAAHAVVFFLKNVLKQDVTHNSFILPSRSETLKKVITLTPIEIKGILQACTRVQDHLALSITYGAGLEISELTNIRVKDIDFNNNKITIRDKSNRIKRIALLPTLIKHDLQKYISSTRPKQWLFEQKLSPNKQPQSRPFQRAFRRAAAISGVDSQHSFRSLRYAYVMHMQFFGIPLGHIGKELGMSSHTVQKWLTIGESQHDINFTPLDRLFVQTSFQSDESITLRNIIRDIIDSNERDYLNEAINCYDVKAYRAAIILAWQAVIYRLRTKLHTHSINAINQEISRHDHNAREIKIIDDLSLIKESTLLEIARGLGIYDRNVKSILQECLNVRNKCGHPGQYSPGASKTSAYLEDLFTHIFDRITE